MKQTTHKLNKSKQSSSCLYLVATPIGNMGDISNRAIEILSTVDLIACEDTRVSGKLLSYHSISTPLWNYHDHNADKVRPHIIEKLDQGLTVALISDAGTPLISDPGYKLVRDLLAAGHKVEAIPGACSLIIALTVSGLPTDQFFFKGFLPAKSKARQTELQNLDHIPGTIIFFESSNRLLETLEDMHSILGQRQAAVARELTKKFEEVKRGKLDELIQHYKNEGLPKGEIVIVLGSAENEHKLTDQVKELIEITVSQKSVRDTADLISTVTGLSRSIIYDVALEIKNANI